MPCQPFKIGQLRGIVCFRRRRTKAEQHLCCKGGCREKTQFQCDYEISKGKTCDAYICIDHAHEVGGARHYCPKHEICAKQDQQLNLFK